MLIFTSDLAGRGRRQPGNERREGGGQVEGSQGVMGRPSSDSYTGEELRKASESHTQNSDSGS